MGKRRPKDISVVDVEDLWSHLANEAALKWETAPLPNPLPAGGARGLVLHVYVIAAMQGKSERYFGYGSFD